MLVASFEPTGGSYLVRWATPVFEKGVGRVTVERIGGQPKIVIGLGDGTLRVYDGATKALERQTSVGAAITDIPLADADNDGTDELVVATSRSLHLLAPATLTEEQGIDQGAADVEVGNVDADPALELVLVSGSVLEIDGTEVDEEWNFSSFGAGVHLGLGDVDGDGMQEIVSAQNWYYLDVYDADVRSHKYQVRTDLDVHALTLVDVTGDGRVEILYGAQWGSVHALDGASGVQLWEVPNPEHGITRIAVADTDGDGARELLWGGGWTSTGADNLFVSGLASRKESHGRATAATRTERTFSFDSGSPLHALALADMDGDGAPEVVAGNWVEHTGSPGVFVYWIDGATGAVEWKSPSLAAGFGGVRDLDVGDVTGDGVAGVVVVGDADQRDTDGDGVGDSCNDARDADGDEWSDALDDCPADANADQADRDGDGEGDVCDRYPDHPDNYAARCDEAVANEATLAGELAQCHARRFFVDGDGEEDSTDACRGTPSGSPVDSAGCSQAEVCARARRNPTSASASIGGTTSRSRTIRATAAGRKRGSG